MIDYSLLQGSLNPLNLFKVRKYKRHFLADNPFYFRPDGLIVFCGAQGSGKTLSGVQYVRELTWRYPKCKLVTNVKIKGLNPLVEVIDYTGIDSLTNIENGYFRCCLFY